jgi:hypothetical protein
MENELPPLSLEEMDERLSQIEDSAWVAGSHSAALEFILGNLLIALDKAKVIDGMVFTQRLESIVPLLEASPQISATQILVQLREAFLGKAPDGYVLH